MDEFCVFFQRDERNVFSGLSNYYLIGGVRTMPVEDFLNSVSRYDLVLAVIPTAFITALVAANLLQLSTQTTLVAAAIVGALALLDALFINPPGHPGNPL